MRKDITQAFQEFLFESEYVKKVSAETLRSYNQAFSLFKKLIPEAELNCLSSEMLMRFFKMLQERHRVTGRGIIKKGIRKSTVVTYWRKLNVFFMWLVVKGYHDTNPFSALACPSPEYEDRKFLQKPQLEKILTAIHLHHDGNLLLLKRNLLIFHLLLFCGLRKEELLQLQVRDIDLEKKILTVRAETSKTRSSRQIPIHSSLALYLQDYLSSRKSYTSQKLLLSAHKDLPFTSHGLKHLVTKLCFDSGISFHLHQFRHTFAVNFLHSSKNIGKLKQLMGHKSIAMTMTYLRCLPVDEMRNDIETMSIEKLI